MASPIDMMGGGPPPEMGGGPPGGPPPSMGGDKPEPTIEDLISALKLLPMEVRQQIAAEIVEESPAEAGGPPPSLEGGAGGPMEEIAKARAGGGPPV